MAQRRIFETNLMATDLAKDTRLANAKPRRAPRFVLTFEPKPDIDVYKALRWTLKTALRRDGLKCVNIRRKR
jgi:hypothetical protein